MKVRWYLTLPFVFKDVRESRNRENENLEMKKTGNSRMKSQSHDTLVGKNSIPFRFIHFQR